MADEPAVRGLVSEGLTRFGIHPDDLHFVKYRENHVYCAVTGEGSFAVRLHRKGLHQDDEILSELAYLAALHGRGFAVPEPVSALDGSVLCTLVADDGGELQLDVQAWFEGMTPAGDIGEAFEGRSPLTTSDFHRMGALAGELHNHTEELGRPSGYRRAAWDAAGLVGPSALWGDPLAIELTAAQRGTLRQAMVTLEQELAKIGKDSSVFGVIHADFTPENILIGDQGIVLIDFDDFGEGWHLFELATLLFFFSPDARFEQFVDAAFAGYRTHRALSTNHAAFWPTMLLARGLTYLAWAGSRPGNETADFIQADVLPLVMKMAEQLLADRSR